MSQYCLLLYSWYRLKVQLFKVNNECRSDKGDDSDVQYSTWAETSYSRLLRHNVKLPLERLASGARTWRWNPLTCSGALTALEKLTSHILTILQRSVAVLMSAPDPGSLRSTNPFLISHSRSELGVAQEHSAREDFGLFEVSSYGR